MFTCDKAQLLAKRLVATLEREKERERKRVRERGGGWERERERWGEREGER